MTNDEHGDGMEMLALTLPADVAAQLKDLRAQFGDELLIELVRAACGHVKSRLALRGVLNPRQR
jgi:hypothetical protein